MIGTLNDECLKRIKVGWILESQPPSTCTFRLRTWKDARLLTATSSSPVTRSIFHGKHNITKNSILYLVLGIFYIQDDAT